MSDPLHTHIPDLPASQVAPGRGGGIKSPKKDPDFGLILNPRPTINIVPPSVPTHRTIRTPSEITVNESAAGSYIDVLFGRVQQGLKILYEDSFDGGDTLYIVAGIGEGPCQSVIPSLDDVPMTNSGFGYWEGRGGYARAWIYLGSLTGTQETASGLFAADPTWITTGTGYDNLCYIVYKITFNQQNSSTIPKITHKVQGYADVLNTRTSTRGYTDDPALIIREVMSNARWGFKIPTATAFNDATWSTAADDCEVNVFPATPSIAPTIALGGAGNIAFGVYWYTYTVVNANGVESVQAPLSSSLIVTSQSVNVTVPAVDTLVASCRVYRSGNGDSPTMHYVGTISGHTGGVLNDNVLLSTWSAAAIPPPIAPYTTHRYSLNIVCGRQASGNDWLNTLRAHCLGVFGYDAGKYEFYINKPLPGGYVRQVFSEFRNWGGNNEEANVDPGSIRGPRRKRRLDTFNEVEIRYNDIQNGFAPTNLPPIQRAGVIAGTEIARRSVYELPGIPDSSMAGRIGVNLLNLDLDDATVTWNADRSALKTQVWDVVALTGNGLTSFDVRVRKITGNGEGFTIIGTEYHDASYSDALNSAYAPIVAGASGINPATVTPPTPPAPTLTQEGLNIKVVFADQSASYPYYASQEIRVQQAGFSAYILGNEKAGPLYISAVTIGALYTVTAKTINVFGNTSAVATATITPSIPAPEPPSFIYQSSDSLGVWWEPPPVRDAILYGAGSWSIVGAGHSVWDASKINDGNLTVSALVWNGGGATGYAVLDLGTALTVREVEITWLDATGHPIISIDTSPDNSTWTPLPMASFMPVVYPATVAVQYDSPDKFKTVFFLPPSIGAKRYIRVSKGSTNTARIAEIQVRKYTGVAYGFTKGFGLTGRLPTSLPGNQSSDPAINHTEDIFFQPTDTNYMPISQWTVNWSHSDPANNSYINGHRLLLYVQTIASDDARSDGRGYCESFSNISTTGSATPLPLVNGAAAVGVATLLSPNDHVHPTDTTRAPTASPSFTGTMSVVGPVGGISFQSSDGVNSTLAIKHWSTPIANVVLIYGTAGSNLHLGANNVGILLLDNAGDATFSGHVLLGADNTKTIGSNTARAKAIYPARLITGASTPTVSVSGAGSGATVTVETGSADLAGIITITAGTGAAANGSVLVTLSTGNGAYGTNMPVGLATLMGGSALWDQRATIQGDPNTSNTAVRFAWDNNGVGLTNAATYKIAYLIIGK